MYSSKFSYSEINEPLSLHETLFIVGAGAHKPYGMPTSIELRDTLLAVTQLGPFSERLSAYLEGTHPLIPVWLDFSDILSSNPTPFLMEDDRVGFNITGALVESSRQRFIDFLQRFSRSEPRSIDSFLAASSKWRDQKLAWYASLFGRSLLAYSIAYSENEGGWMYQRDWIHAFIASYVEPDPKRFFKNPPKIVTFNYDQILERILYHHLVDKHDFSASEAAQMINSLSILHVYGSIGNFQNSITVNSSASILQQIDQISVIDRNVDKQNIKQQLSLIATKVRNVIFLGYGFDSLNNEMIQESNLISDKNDFGQDRVLISTNYGLKQSDLKRIYESFKTLPKFLGPNFSCLDLIQEGLTFKVDKPTKYLATDIWSGGLNIPES